MEKKVGSLVLMSCLVMGILVEQTRAQGWAVPVGKAAICYAACFIPCTSRSDAGSCALQCLPKCLPKKSTSGGSGSGGALKDTQYFCSLGCSTALCAKLSTKENPAAKKVGSCMESCSAISTKKN
ncbi:hypothetical protein PTKIN_Ptkin18bG0053300 [Pterospermum kingtungense]